MEIDQLRAFIILAKTKNFSKAAEHLHIVQSAVSTRIQALEARIGKPLFFRDNRKVELTPAGEALRPYAERILSLTEAGSARVRSLGVFEDKLSVGSTGSFWHFLLQPTLVEFCRRHPTIALSTYTGHSYEVVQALMDGVIQLGVVYLPPHLPGVRVIPFFDDEMVLVSGAKDASTKGEFDRERIGRLGVMSIPYDGAIQAWISRALPPDYQPQLRIDQITMVLHLLKQGVGAAFLPRYTVRRELKEGALRELKLVPSLKPPRLHGYAIHRREKSMRGVVEKWLKLMLA